MEARWECLEGTARRGRAIELSRTWWRAGASCGCVVSAGQNFPAGLWAKLGQSELRRVRCGRQMVL
eukprot:5583964-Prymnesium_polylepis.1